MKTYKNIIFNTFVEDAWHTLKNSNKPILIYGMGNGADKIISVFDKYGIEYCDVFASDGFVRGHSYRGKRVLSYSEACDKYVDFDIVVSFGSKLPDVIERIYSLEGRHNVYSLDVPVCDGELFNEEFFDIHQEELLNARECFCDEKSKLIFDDIIRYKLTGKLCYLKSTACKESEADNLLNLNDYRTFLDLGAYNGDTIKKYMALCPNLQEIYAFEPDKRNFKKLLKYCEEINTPKIYAVNYAAYSSDTELSFSFSGNRNSSAASLGSYQHTTNIIEAKAPDNIVKKADFIKFDVEGMEADALLGCSRLIGQIQPDMLVSMYHKSEDMYTLPTLVKKLNPNYSLYLRRLPYIPAWDLNLYAIKTVS